MTVTIPTAQRTACILSRRLSPDVTPLLQAMLDSIVVVVKQVFAVATFKKMSSTDIIGKCNCHCNSYCAFSC